MTAPTPTATVTVELDRPRELRYTNAVLGLRLEKETRMTADEHLRDISLRGSLYSITAMVWAGLLHAEPGLTLDEAATRIDLAKLEQVSNAVGEAYGAAFGLTPGKAKAANRASRRATARS